MNDDFVEGQYEDVEMNEEGIGQNISQFFYWNGKLFFSIVISEFTHYQMDDLKTITENRYYYKNDKPIRCLEKYVEGKTYTVSTNDVKNKEIECNNLNFNTSENLLYLLNNYNIPLK